MCLHRRERFYCILRRKAFTNIKSKLTSLRRAILNKYICRRRWQSLQKAAAPPFFHLCTFSLTLQSGSPLMLRVWQAIKFMITTTALLFSFLSELHNVLSIFSLQNYMPTSFDKSFGQQEVNKHTVHFSFWDTSGKPVNM